MLLTALNKGIFMTFKDIVTKKTFTKDGVEKATWLKVGTLRTNDAGKSFIELNHQPDTTFFVFEPKAKDTGNPGNAAKPEQIDWQE
jgi:hypothetical protein